MKRQPMRCFAAAALVALVGGMGLVVAARHGGSTAKALSVVGRRGGRPPAPPSSHATAPAVTPGRVGRAAAPAPGTASRGPATTATTTAATQAARGRTATTPTTTGRPAATTAAAPTGPAPAAPGTYRYRQAGTLPSLPAEGTLVVAPVSAAGTQVWSRTVGGSVAASTSVMLFNKQGSFLVSPGTAVPGGAASCTFATPVAWPPWPTMPGQSVFGQAACTGPISSYQVTGRVESMTSVPLDGQTVTAAVVVNTFVLRGSYGGSPITVTFVETDEYAPDLRIPVVTRTQISGRALGLSISTSRTDTLVSATPS